MRHDTLIAESPLTIDALPLEVAVVVPTLNEAANVEKLIAKLSVVLAGRGWEVVFVDDDSPDGTSALVRRIGRTSRHVRIVQRVGRRGLSSAVVEGILAPAAPVVAGVDGDPPPSEEALPGRIAAVQSGKAPG